MERREKDNTWLIISGLVFLSFSFSVFIITRTVAINPSLINISQAFGEEQKTFTFESRPIIIPYYLETEITNGTINSYINTSQDFVKVEFNELKNCSSQSYNFVFDVEAIKSASDTEINLDNYLLNKEETDTLKQLCNKYQNDKLKINSVFKQLLNRDDLIDNGIITMYIQDTNAFWKINNYSKFQDILIDYKKSTDKPASNGNYEIINGFIATFSEVSDGQMLNIEQSFENTENWLKDINATNLAFHFDYTSPEIYTMGMQIYDFSQNIAKGQTRIDLIRNGQGNEAVYFAELGLEEIQKAVIMPGEEFSYIKKIEKVPGLNQTKNGRLIGSGYCNSTTTIFRAALEAGLQITDRAPHAMNVLSYDWGYPYNMVDAAFFAVPGLEVDLKFVNNFSYPIMLTYGKDWDGNGNQFHFVNVLTDKNAIKRNVELYDWRKWNEQSYTVFEGEFKRKVTENGNLILEDSFYSRYYNI